MRVAVFITHPIQYFSPLWRAIAAEPDVELVVHYFSDHSVRGGRDDGFGVEVAWDVPLLEGYDYRFIQRDADINRSDIALPGASALLEEGRFDAVIVSGYAHLFSRQVLQAARRLGIRTVMRAEFSDTEPFGGRGRLKSVLREAYLKWIYRYVDAFCYIGEDARLHLLRRKISPARMFHSPYSVDTPLLESQRQAFPRARCRAELGIDDDQRVVLFSGKFIPRKAPLLLLEALGKVSGIGRVVVVFLGDGPLRQEIEAESKKLLGSRYRIPGFVNQSQLGKYFAASDLFVLPSHHETWGLVVNEAMQFGLPVVVGERVACHRDLVREGETGFTVPDGDRDALARALERLVNDPGSAARMGNAAREHVAGFSIQESADGILRALRAGPSGAPKTSGSRGAGVSSN